MDNHNVIARGDRNGVRSHLSTFFGNCIKVSSGNLAAKQQVSNETESKLESLQTFGDLKIRAALCKMTITLIGLVSSLFNVGLLFKVLSNQNFSQASCCKFTLGVGHKLRVSPTPIVAAFASSSFCVNHNEY